MDGDMLRLQELNKAIIASEDCSKAIFITMASINAIETRLNLGLRSQLISHNLIVRSLTDQVADGQATLLAGINLLHNRINIKSACVARLELSSSVPTSE
eukprot:scaffold168210_cov31-Attheya_sp.AAC.3